VPRGGRPAGPWSHRGRRDRAHGHPRRVVVDQDLITRGIEPGTGISWAQRGGRDRKPIARAATAGNSELQVGCRGEDAAGPSRAGSRPLRLAISRISSVRRIEDRLGLVELGAVCPRRAKDRIRAILSEHRRAQALEVGLTQKAATCPRRGCRSRAAEGGPAQRLNGVPTASHIRRTWRLRPRGSSARAFRAPAGAPRAGAVGPSSSVTRRGACGSPVHRRVPLGPRRRRFLGISNRGCVHAMASSPSLVRRIRPVESMSRRPTGVEPQARVSSLQSLRGGSSPPPARG